MNLNQFQQQGAQTPPISKYPCKFNNWASLRKIIKFYWKQEIFMINIGDKYGETSASHVFHKFWIAQSKEH